MLHRSTKTPFFICLIKCINLQQNIDWWQWTTRFLFVWVLIDVVVLCVSPCVFVSIADKNPWGKYINLLSFFVCDSVCVFVCVTSDKNPLFSVPFYCCLSPHFWHYVRDLHCVTVRKERHTVILTWLLNGKKCFLSSIHLVTTNTL